MRTLQILGLMICAAIVSQVSTVRAQEDAHVATAGTIRIVHAWARAALAGDTTLVFMEIENTGATVRLAGVKTNIAERAAVVGIMMKGTELSTVNINSLDIPPGTVQLDPGGLAIKLENLSEELVAGEEIELVLTFEPDGELPIHASVEPSEALEHSHAGHSHD